MPYLSELAGKAHTGGSFICGSWQDMGWFDPSKKKKVNIFAVGDVGSFLLTGLVLKGADAISEIGVYDIREHVGDRFEFELNQILDPAAEEAAPRVSVIGDEALFDCDVFLFCASLRVPPVSEGGDVRMAQFEANAGLVTDVAAKAVRRGYQGLFCVVSDPVDLLCRAALAAGLPPFRVKGFGLGVMNARACYYSRKDPRFSAYPFQGRAFGPHGEDLVIADSICNYNDEISRELTRLTVEANLVMRSWGFKPYIAPALSSGALSLLAVLRGDWHYSSTWFDGAYFGARCRCTACGIEVEDPMLPDALYERCRAAYEGLIAAWDKKR